MKQIRLIEPSNESNKDWVINKSVLLDDSRIGQVSKELGNNNYEVVFNEGAPESVSFEDVLKAIFAKLNKDLGDLEGSRISIDDEGTIFNASLKKKAMVDIDQKKAISSTVTFPQILHNILSNQEHSSIISWSSDGKSCEIHSIGELSTILPKYFRSAELKNFIRKFNRWGFQRVTGCESMIFEHHLFVKDDPSLISGMVHNHYPSSNQDMNQSPPQRTHQVQHTLQSGETSGADNNKAKAPPFIESLRDMITHVAAVDPDVISWTKDGEAFHIKDQSEEKLGPYLLRFFNHNNFNSLHKKLSESGFTRLSALNGAYYHSDFRRKTSSASRRSRKQLAQTKEAENRKTGAGMGGSNIPSSIIDLKTKDKSIDHPKITTHATPDASKMLPKEDLVGRDHPGVSRKKSKWQAGIYFSGKSRYIGLFDTQEEAISSREAASELLKNASDKEVKSYDKNNDVFRAAVGSKQNCNTLFKTAVSSKSTQAAMNPSSAVVTDNLGNIHAGAMKKPQPQGIRGGKSTKEKVPGRLPPSPIYGKFV